MRKIKVEITRADDGGWIFDIDGKLSVATSGTYGATKPIERAMVELDHEVEAQGDRDAKPVEPEPVPFVETVRRPASKADDDIAF